MYGGKQRDFVSVDDVVDRKVLLPWLALLHDQDTSHQAPPLSVVSWEINAVTCGVWGLNSEHMASHGKQDSQPLHSAISIVLTFCAKFPNNLFSEDCVKGVHFSASTIYLSLVSHSRIHSFIHL